MPQSGRGSLRFTLQKIPDPENFSKVATVRRAPSLFRDAKREHLPAGTGFVTHL